MNKYPSPIVIMVFGVCCIGFGVALVPVAEQLDKNFSPPPKPGLAGSQSVGPVHTFEDLIDAIEWVESKGDANAVGDSGGAIGAYQLHRIFIDDVNRIRALRGFHSTRVQYHERWDKKSSRLMTEIYLLHYGGTLEEKARKFNGGPDGWRNDPHWFVRNRDYTLEAAKRKIANTKAYWLKVKARMESQELMVREVR